MHPEHRFRYASRKYAIQTNYHPRSDRWLSFPQIGREALPCLVVGLGAFVVATGTQEGLVLELVGFDSTDGLVSLLIGMEVQGRLLCDMAK